MGQTPKAEIWVFISHWLYFQGGWGNKETMIF